MSDDPIIDRIQIARQHISKKCNYDPQKLIEYYLQRQNEHNHKILKTSSEIISPPPEN